MVHQVLFRFKPEAKSLLGEAVARLLAMKGKVDPIVTIKAGRDVLGSARSFDLGLVVTLADRKALDAYDHHPEHEPVKAFLRPLIDQSVSVDFLIDE